MNAQNLSRPPRAAIPPRDRLIVALDFPDVDAARAMTRRLGDAVSFYKVGMELIYGGGLPFVGELADQGKQVFVDLKLHDISNTVEKATARIASLGGRFLTVHAYPQTMQAAARGRGDSALQILGVTVMTSYDDAELLAAGYAAGVRPTVALRAGQARDAGIDGLILSAEEVADIRPLVGDDMLLVTPGIRPAGAALGDQKRAVTPGQAIANGADYLVVGRPVTEAADPVAVAQAIVQDIEMAL